LHVFLLPPSPSPSKLCLAVAEGGRREEGEEEEADLT